MARKRARNQEIKAGHSSTPETPSYKGNAGLSGNWPVGWREAEMSVSLSPGPISMLYLTEQRDFADVIQLSTLKWEIILDYPGSIKVTTKVHKREKGDKRAKIEEMTMKLRSE